MGKIFLVNAIHNCAISEAGIWQCQEHPVNFDITAMAFVLVSWSHCPERCSTWRYERQPAWRETITKSFKLRFFYTYPLYFPSV